MESLHYQDDCAHGRIVESAAECRIDPVVGPGSLGIAQRLICAHRIIQDRGVAAPPHRRRSYTRGDHLAALVVGVLRYLIAIAQKLEALAKKSLKPGGLQ